MSGAVFSETLRRNWRAMLYWGLSAGALAFVMVIVVPNAEALQAIMDLMNTMPRFLLDAFGGTDAAFMATPQGYLTLNLYSWVLLIFATYAVLAGLSVTANEEEQHIMDVLLSLPLPRWRIIIEKTLAYALVIVGMIVLTFLGTWIGVLVTPTMTITTERVIEVNLMMIPASLAVLGFTVMAAGLLRRRNNAATLAAVFVVIGYVLDLIGRATKGTVIDQLRALSYYTYYDAVGTMMGGIAWGNVLVLLVASVVTVAIGVWAFERRDVGV